MNFTNKITRQWQSTYNQAFTVKLSEVTSVLLHHFPQSIWKLFYLYVKPFTHHFTVISMKVFNWPCAKQVGHIILPWPLQTSQLLTNNHCLWIDHEDKDGTTVKWLVYWRNYFDLQQCLSILVTTGEDEIENKQWEKGWGHFNAS